MKWLKFLSKEADCMRELDMQKIKDEPHQTYTVIHDFIGEFDTAHVVHIFVESRDKEYLADKRTGTLYDIETLRCLTGPLELVKCHP